MEHRRKSPRRRDTGFALIEVLIGLAILTVAFLGTMSGMFFSLRLNETNEETSRGVQMARAVLEEVRSCSVDRIFAEYNDDPADDPDGPGSAHGGTFTVAQVVSAAKQDPDGAPVATVHFPTAEDGSLREDVPMPDFAVPIDLNGDGVITGGDRSRDYLVLPVLVRVRWTGSDGERTVEFFTILRE